MKRRIVGVLAVGAVMLGLWAGTAAAGPCSVGGNAWNPDPSVSNSGPCGPGDGDNNDTIEVLNGTTFTEWDKDSAVNLTDNDFFITGTKKSGFWYWDATDSLAAGNDVFAMVLKDGSVKESNGPPPVFIPTQWAFFILDNPSGAESTWLTNPITAGGCESASGAPAAGAFTHCGTWSMYGSEGTIKDLSHVSLYGADTLEETPLPPTAVPEPGTLLLLGLGLAGTGFVNRMRKAAR